MKTPTILGIIPARGGSKGIPRKNIRLLGDKPLLAWTVQTALQSAVLDRLILTTEDEEIAEVGRTCGCEVLFLRPQELATDETPGIEPVLHAINWLEAHEGYVPEFVMLLQPTSPFRTSEQMKQTVKQISTSNFDSLVSVVEPKHPPQWMFVKDTDKALKPLLSSERPVRRQDSPESFALNGAIYITRTTVLKRERTFMPERTMGYVMDRLTSLDLDDMVDWKVAECLLSLVENA